MKKLLIITLLLLSSACLKVNEVRYYHATVPEFMIEHAQAICYTHNGIRDVDITARRVRHTALANYEVYCADVIATCKDDHIQVTYDTCDKKWYKENNN